jgi:hypothetical protein
LRCFGSQWQPEQFFGEVDDQPGVFDAKKALADIPVIPIPWSTAPETVA